MLPMIAFFPGSAVIAKTANEQTYKFKEELGETPKMIKSLHPVKIDI